MHSKFFKAHISVMGNHWTMIFYHIITRLILNIFLKTLYITKKTPNLVAKILATKFGFVPDLISWWDVLLARNSAAILDFEPFNDNNNISKQYLTNFVVFFSDKNIYLWVNFVYRWQLIVELRKFLFFIFQHFFMATILTMAILTMSPVICFPAAICSI